MFLSRRIIIPLLIAAACIAAGSFFSFSQKGKRIPDSRIPDSLVLRLSGYKARNHLADWLKAGSDFIKAAPQDRYFFYSWSDTALWRIPHNDSAACTAYFSYLLYHGYDALKVKGDVAQSMDCYEQALRFYQSDHTFIQKDSSFFSAYLLKPLGNVYTRMGDYKSALLIHRINSNVLRSLNDTQELAATMGNMAVACRWQDSLELARSYIREGLLLADSGSRTYAYLQSIAAEVSLCAADLSQAEQQNTTAITCYQRLLQQTGSDAQLLAEGLAACKGTASDICKAKNLFDVAIRNSREGLALLNRYFPEGHNREKSIALKRIGDIQLLQQAYPLSIGQYDAALRQLLPAWRSKDQFPEERLLFPDNTIIDALAGKAQCLAALQQDTAALKGMMLAAGLEQKIRLKFQSETAKLEQLLRSRSRTESILEMAGRLYSNSRDQQYLAIMLRQIERSKAQVLMEQWTRSFAAESDTTTLQQNSLNNKISFYKRRLAESAPDAADYDYFTARLKEQEYELSLLDANHYSNNEQILARMDSSGPQGWLNTLPEDMVVLDYFAGSRNIYLLTLVKGKIAQLTVTDSAALWKARVGTYMQQYFYSGPEKIMAQPDLFCTASVLLYRHLLPPLDWEQYKTCMVIPDDYLYQLPFDALQTTDKDPGLHPGHWPYLMQRIPLHSAFSLQLWLLQSGRHNSSPAHQDKSTVKGFFIADFKTAYPALPEVRAEYKSMKAGICDQAWLDAAATKAKLKAQLEQHNIVHISTHGLQRGRDRVPALVMGDSLFYGWELEQIQAAAPLVILNTCKSADGLLQEGEGVVSMARYFTAAGFNGVIASLWNVNDKSGAAVMNLFYKEMARYPSPAQSLHRAKKEWLDNHDVPATDKTPYYWAGFVYSGIGQDIVLKQQHTFDIRMGIALCILFGSGLGWLAYRNRRRQQPLT